MCGAQQIDLLCAGTGGKITREDVLLAGAIVARLTAPAGDRNRSAAAPSEKCGQHRANDQAAIARDTWLLAVAELGEQTLAQRLCKELRQTQGGRNLAALHLENDLADAAAIDRYAIVPRFDPRTGRITPA